jgi:ATP-dependent exoDNAse (exonuclease V) beta subunit
MVLFFINFQKMNTAGKLLKYSASAGSGKTHALTAFYLSRILHDPGAYRRILAVTFTNAAAAEMKSRILKRLHLLGLNGEKGDDERGEFTEYLCRFFPEVWPDRQAALLTVKKNAPVALGNILQDYSRFTVGTIDSFFQRVIRAFAREIDIPAGYEIELEHQTLLSDAVDSLLSQVATDGKLRGWISSYVASRLDESKGWDIRREILHVADQVFRENFRQLSTEDRKKISDYTIMANYASTVHAIRQRFENELKRMAGEAVTIYSECGLTPEDFLSKTKGGVGETLRKYSQGDVRKPGATWMKAAAEGKYLAASAGKEIVTAFSVAMSRGLGERVTAITEWFDREYGLYVSALAQMRTIHVIGILGAISERVREQANEQNIFLLSDAGELISRLIADDDTPFIYEKIGAAYDHFIIDEFQDTSRIQWNNFRPLIAETLSRGKDNLVVGDVKQSIYRWRNSDWRIIHSEAAAAFGQESVRPVHLSTNYRSRGNIIAFNNSIFGRESIPSLCDEKLNFDMLKLGDVYSDSGQEGTEGKKGGLVRVTLYPKSEDEGWKERVLNDLPAVIEQIQDHGYGADEILFLCRTNEEGKQIISRILEYSATCTPEQREHFNYEITSGESLLLERNPAVTLIISCLRYLTDPASRINRSQMVRSYILATGGDERLLYSGDAPVPQAESMTADTPVRTEATLPQGWEQMLESYRNSSLFSATENIIRFFGLGENSENIAYISSFQDAVLTWSGRHSSDISAFVRWWDDDGCTSTLNQSDRQEAMRVMTIHRAKGLQSRVVIVPFAAWDFTKSGFNRQLLWVTDVPPPFAPMPVVLPEMSSKLDESLFAVQARMEKVSDWLDGINLLYVAFTRAVDALFIMSPEVQGTTGSGANSGALLNQALAKLPANFTRRETDSMTVVACGELPPVVREEHEQPLEMNRYTVSEPRAALRLRTGGALPQDELKLGEPGGRAYGIMMHDLLSRIITTADIEPAVERACAGGLLPADRRNATVTHLHELLSSDTVRPWFNGNATVMTEASVILPSGAARRPDRVMIRDGQVTIVDYKFGEPSPRHRQQAAAYREILARMGYAGVRSWLWYVEKNIIEEA